MQDEAAQQSPLVISSYGELPALDGPAPFFKLPRSSPLEVHCHTELSL